LTAANTQIAFFPALSAEVQVGALRPIIEKYTKITELELRCIPAAERCAIFEKMKRGALPDRFADAVREMASPKKRVAGEGGLDELAEHAAPKKRVVEKGDDKTGRPEGLSTKHTSGNSRQTPTHGYVLE
ncbi:unnamed protein product, partial [Amoebophrya sp. A25]